MFGHDDSQNTVVPMPGTQPTVVAPTPPAVVPAPVPAPSPTPVVAPPAHVVAPAAAAPSAPVAHTDAAITGVGLPSLGDDTFAPSPAPLPGSAAQNTLPTPGFLDPIVAAPNLTANVTSAPSMAPKSPTAASDHSLSSSAPAHAPVPLSPMDSDDLLNIKHEALTSLSPLIDHLEQSPEERFRTTMMLIQASDDQSLIRSAYDSAKAIDDEKIRAQALLDIVNEINYFTAPHSSQE